ncbi:MAG: hypothetical protein IT198_16065 [Acidimicrobiia bacterium]|nr:hypothetical protein [Acidimicrobiia bacterium]
MRNVDIDRVFGLLAAEDPAPAAEIDRELAASPTAHTILTRSSTGHEAESEGRQDGTPQVVTAAVPIRRTPRRALVATFAAVAAALLLVAAIVAITSREATEIEPADTTTTGVDSTTTRPQGEHGQVPADAGTPGDVGGEQAPPAPGQDSADPDNETQDGRGSGTPSDANPVNPPATGSGLPPVGAPLAGRAPYPAAVSGRSPLPFCGVAHLHETEDLVGAERLPVECFYYWVDRNEPVEVILTGTPPDEQEGTQILRHFGDRNTVTYRNFPDSQGDYTWSIQACHRMTKNPTILRLMGPGAYCDAAAPIS